MYIPCADKAGHVCCYACHNIIFECWTGKPGNGFSCAICCDEAFTTAGQKTASATTGLKASQAGTAEDPVLLDGFKHGQPVRLKKDFILRVFADGNPQGCSKDAFSSLAKQGATVYVWGDHEVDCREICVGLIHNWDDVLTHYEDKRHDLGMIAADMVYGVPGKYETFEITCVKTHTNARPEIGPDIGMPGGNGGWDGGDEGGWDGGDGGCSSMAAAALGLK
jgi:hypothetical protein